MSIAALDQALLPDQSVLTPARVSSRPRSAGRRLGDRRREPPTPRRSLVVDHGCDVRLAHVRLEPDVVMALLEWLPLAHGDLAFLERGAPRAPVTALGAVLRPPTIWSPVEALAARSRVHDAPGLERYAARRVTPLHVKRLRRAVARIATQLPLAGLPRASAVVAAGCATLLADEIAGAEAAAEQLVRYATSDLIRVL